MSAWEITNLVGLLLMPPGCLLVVTALGLLLLRSRRALGATLIVLSWLALYALSTPHVGRALVRSLEDPYLAPDGARADAIVVLGGGLYFGAPEFGGEDTVNPAVLARLRYAARLYREFPKPVLVSGGSPRGSGLSEAAAMKRVLEEDYNVPVRWAESDSTNTSENARYSRRIVEDGGVKTVLLVTHAWHMPRARASFERAGFDVVPAPTLFKTREPATIVDFLPTAEGLRDSSIYFHEAIGMAWYRLRFVISSWSA